jgi:hypothetical protein
MHSRVLTPEIRQMIWKLAVTVDRVICGPRAEQWHVTVRLHRYAFRKPGSFLQVFLEHASTTSDTLQGLQATLRKLEVDSMPYVSRSDPVYELDRNAIYIPSSKITWPSWTRTSRSCAQAGTCRLESCSSSACHNGTAQVELRLVTDTDNMMQRIERSAARH